MIFPVSFMLLSTIIASVIYIIFPMATFLYFPFALISGLISNYLIFTSNALANIPFASVSVAFPFLRLWVAFTLILVALAIIFGDIRKKTKLIALLSLNLLLIGILSYQICMKDVIRASVLNVGDGCSLLLSKNGHAAMLSCGGEDKYLKNVSASIENMNIRKLDYLLAPSVDSESICFLESTATLFSPAQIALSRSCGVSSQLLKNNSNIVKFNNSIHSKIWGNVDVLAVARGNKPFIFVKVFDITLLLCPAGGNALDIPIKWRNCDFFIVGGIPENYQCIKPLCTVISMNHDSCITNINKLFYDNLNPISAFGECALHIDMGKSHNIAIRRDI